MNIGKTSLSKWYLALIFLAALLLISAIRFDVDALVRGELDKFSSRSGVQLDFDELTLLGLNAHFSHVSVNSSRFSEAFIFESVKLVPEWGSLLTGDNVVDVDLEWQGDAASTVLTQADGKIHLQHIRFEGDVGRISRLVIPYLNSPFPVSVSGSLEADGEVLLNQISGEPEQGTIAAHWLGAKAGAMGAEFALGDLLMELQGNAGQWRWQLRDGDVGMIEASGSLEQLAAPVAMWPVQGSVVIDVTKINDPYLIAWLPDMGEEKKIRLRLSGTLSRPRLDRIK